MKQSKLIISVLVLLLTGRANANVQPNQPVKEENADARVQRAIQTLLEEKIIVLDQAKDKLELREDVIEQMRALGLIQTADSDFNGFCQ